MGCLAALKPPYWASIAEGVLNSKIGLKSAYESLNNLDFEGGFQTIFMVTFSNTIQSTSAVQSQMLSYIDEALNQAQRKYKCRVNSDEDWIKYGVARVLHSHDSGREFFQDLRMESLGELSIKRLDFQEGLKSKRRLEHLTSVNKSYLLARSQQAWKSKSGGFSDSLDNFHIYAADGHFHAASTHEPRDSKGKKNAIGNLYALNLRTTDVSHLALSSDGKKKKPHDMGVLKRMDIGALKQGALKGQKVLYVWDRACIDFTQWMHWKHNNAIYFLTRTKENMTKTVIGNIPYDRDDTENSGVLKNQYIEGGEAIRMVTYHDAQLDKTFEFITNLHHSIPPGVIVQLYRMRWDIEKVFDDFKNKLKETKSWAKSITAKRMQAQFTVLAYNLLLRLHKQTRDQEALTEEAVAEKSEARWLETNKIYQGLNRAIPAWLEKHRRVTQLSVKFIRWARAMFLRASSWRQSIELLRYEYSLKWSQLLTTDDQSSQ